MVVTGLVHCATIGFVAIVSFEISPPIYHCVRALSNMRCTTRDVLCPISNAIVITIRLAFITKEPYIACELVNRIIKALNNNAATIVMAFWWCRMIRCGVRDRGETITLVKCRGMKPTKFQRYPRGSMTCDHIIRVVTGRTNRLLDVKHSDSNDDHRRIVYRIRHLQSVLHSAILISWHSITCSTHSTEWVNSFLLEWTTAGNDWMYKVDSNKFIATFMDLLWLHNWHRLRLVAMNQRLLKWESGPDMHSGDIDWMCLLTDDESISIGQVWNSRVSSVSTILLLHLALCLT